nr:transcription termination factor MTERF4, chloroplastic-like [Physcomitrium patens]|eukprot:XP_024403083.1 transcription termination factor MTERF4, chloroplastic-like [Physcomitrella patens]
MFKAFQSRKSLKVYCLQDSVEDDRSRLINEARSAVAENLIAAGIEEKVALSISENCPHFIEKLMERANEADEILGWANLSLGAEEEGSSTYGLVKSVKLSDPELWCVVLEFVGVRAQAVTRISHVLSTSTLTEFLKKVNFVEEFLNRAQLDGQLFESKVYQMMRRLSVYAYEDVQHTLSFFEKMAAQRGGIALLASAHVAVARLVEGFPHIFLRDLDVELKSVLTFLETIGVPDESLGRVIVLFPPVLLCDPHRDLQARLRTLKKIGVRARDLGRLIVRYPWLLSETAQNNVDELVEFLISVKVPKGDIDRSITACPQLLGCSTIRTLQPMVERMNKLGVKSKRLGYVIAASPQLLVRTPDEFNEVMNFLLKIGVEEKHLGGMLKRHPGVFASDVKSVLEPKVQFLRQLGMKEELLFRVLRFFPEMLTMRIDSLRSRVKYLQDEGFHNEVICCMICRFPPLLSYNPESVLKPKLEFLVNSMGRSIYEVVEYPRYFSYSLEVKIKPRARVIKLRQVKCSLREMLHLNDDQFASKFFGVSRLLVPPS